MIHRTLGSTGERVSAIGLGGWHLSLPHVDKKLAIRIVRVALECADSSALCSYFAVRRHVGFRSRKTKR
jgi:hypothetical protein